MLRPTEACLLLGLLGRGLLGGDLLDRGGLLHGGRLLGHDGLLGGGLLGGHFCGARTVVRLSGSGRTGWLAVAGAGIARVDRLYRVACAPPLPVDQPSQLLARFPTGSVAASPERSTSDGLWGGVNQAILRIDWAGSKGSWGKGCQGGKRVVGEPAVC